MRVRGASVVALLLTFVGSVGSIGLVGSSTACNKTSVDALKLANSAHVLEREDPKAASEMYKQAAGMDPTNFETYEKLAKLYERGQDWQNAAETWAKAASADTPHGSDKFASYYFHRGYDLFKLAKQEREKGDPNSHADDFKKAVDPLKEAIAKDANLENAWYFLGLTYYELDQEQDALDAFTKGLDTNPTDLAAYVNLANLYLDNGYANEGLQVSQSGQQMAPKYKPPTEEEANVAADNLYNLVLDEARADEILQKIDDKIAALKKTESVANPKNTPREAEYQLAIAYFDQKKNVEACDALTKYLQLAVGKSPDSQANHKDAEIRQTKDCKH